MYASLSIWPCLLTCTMGPVLSFLCTFCVCVCVLVLWVVITHTPHMHTHYGLFIWCVFLKCEAITHYTAFDS